MNRRLVTNHGDVGCDRRWLHCHWAFGAGIIVHSCGSFNDGSRGGSRERRLVAHCRRHPARVAAASIVSQKFPNNAAPGAVRGYGLFPTGDFDWNFATRYLDFGFPARDLDCNFRF